MKDNERLQMSSENVIQVEGLTKYYGAKTAVSNLDFSVKKGEIFGFLGPNGAGKTTTIRLLLHLLYPTSGKIRLFNKSLNPNSKMILKRCGYLPGEFAAYTQMTGVEYMRFIASIKGVDNSVQKQLLDRFKISQQDLTKKIKHFSTGMLQKLGIIQAFFHQPELLILDEPTTGLDPLMQEEFYKLVHEAQKNNSTIFFSSHNLPEVEKICSRVAIIREGKLVALEALDALKEKMYRRLELTMKEEIEPLKGIPDLRLVKKNGLHYTYFLRGDIQTILAKLAKLPIDNIIFPEADLEEIFMTYYGNPDEK